MWMYVCVHARTHTHCINGVLSVSPEVRMRHLEGPKNPDGLNLGTHISVYVYKVHMLKTRELQTQLLHYPPRVIIKAIIIMHIYAKRRDEVLDYLTFVFCLLF